MRAFCLIRPQPWYRRDAFCAGLRAVGYEVRDNVPVKPEETDVLVIWNRYGRHDEYAKRFERVGATVLIAENGYLGREWQGEGWYSLSRSRHNGGGEWFPGGPERWERHGVPLKPWREDGDHVLVLLQRGIGVEPVAQPGLWERIVRDTLETDRPIKWRGHPGEKKPHETLYDDLRDCWCCVTWASGAGLKALVEGIPVFYGFDQWIGASAGTPFGGSVETPRFGDRLAMFRSMIWAQWSLPEIESGEPFRHLLR